MAQVCADGMNPSTLTRVNGTIVPFTRVQRLKGWKRWAPSLLLNSWCNDGAHHAIAPFAGSRVMVMQPASSASGAVIA